MDLLRFKPIYQERVWGGRELKAYLARSLLSGNPIGESWELVDRPEAQSVCSTGRFAGKTLREIIELNAEAIMGPDYPPNRPFPILVKWLDCRERLSLQVHPPASKAKQWDGEPKTEIWYIVKTGNDAAVMAGLKAGTTRGEFEKALAEDNLEKLICRLKTEPGDSLFVESGRLHAIDAGNLILEIQQNSDTTYRVYDWGRLGLNGKPRQLHIEQSMESIDFDDFEPKLEKSRDRSCLLVDSPVFSLRKVIVRVGDILNFNTGEQPRILSVVSGELTEKGSQEKLGMGENVLLPFGGSFSFAPCGAEATVLITENFFLTNNS